MLDQIITELRIPYADKGERLVRVYTPHRMPHEKMPVIYMTDGCNLFDEETSSYGCWHTREAMWAERKLSGKAAVIVGIHNDDPMERRVELLPGSIGEIICPEELKPFIKPAGEVFDDFVINTLMPVIEEKFPVKKGRENTAFCGSSMGGLQAFFTVVSHPDLFSAAGVLSPAFPIYHTEDVKNWVLSKMQPEMPYLYFYSGAGEPQEKEIYDSMDAVYEAISEFYPPQLLNEVVLLENKHHETSWEPIFKDFLHTFLTR